MEMRDKLIFLDKLRAEFPSSERFSYEVRCTASDIMKKFNMSSEEVWQYIIELSNDGLIDNNGGDLRFNDYLYEDTSELLLIGRLKETIDTYCKDVTIGFIMKVIRNMYRDNNFCAGKIANISRNYNDVIMEIAKAVAEMERK